MLDSLALLIHLMREHKSIEYLCIVQWEYEPGKILKWENGLLKFGMRYWPLRTMQSWIILLFTSMILSGKLPDYGVPPY